MNAIAIDAGHGYVKGLDGQGQRVLFPSLIAIQPPTVDLGDLAQSQAIRIDDTAYLVGDSARSHATPLWSKNKSADPDTLRLLLIAAAKLGAMGPVDLVTGLPLDWFGTGRKAFREALTGYGGSVQFPRRPAQRLWFERVKVLPQGVAAASAVLASGEYVPGEYLIVDIGYRTTDYIVVTKTLDNTLDYDPNAAGSLERGMHEVSQHVAKALTEAYQVPFSEAELEHQTAVAIRGEKIDLSYRIHEARQTIGRRIAQELATILGPQVDKLMGIIAVGGGSEIMTMLLPMTIVPAQAQWANVLGYQMALDVVPSQSPVK